MFGPLGTPEIIIIGVVIILIFGVGKLSGLGRDLGSSIKEFRRAVKDQDPEDEVADQSAAVASPPQQAATQQAPPPQSVPTPAPAQTPPPAPPPSSEDQGKPNIF